MKTAKSFSFHENIIDRKPNILWLPLTVEPQTVLLLITFVCVFMHEQMFAVASVEVRGHAVGSLFSRPTHYVSPRTQT